MFYLGFTVNIKRWSEKSFVPSTAPVSVIISAHNDREQLEKNLPYILHQEHPEFEVIVVNDRSYDGTKDLLDGMEHPRLKVMHIDPDAQGRTGKKFALTMGIKASVHGIILVTDADCRPSGPNWISTMSAYLKGEKQFVIGYGAYHKTRSIFNRFERFDAFYKGIIMFGMAAMGKPYMALGRNLMYTKELFFEQGGFKKHMNVQSGDDDLFVNSAATEQNTAICVKKEGVTISTPSTGSAQWFRRKRRHFTTGPLYKGMDKFLLSAFSISAMLCWAGILAICFFKITLWIVLGAFMLRLLVQVHIFNRSMKELGDRDLLFFVPILELVLLIMDPIIFISNILVRPRKWK